MSSKSQFCSREKLPNSCNFWKHNLVFLQTLYQSWVPSKITPLYFLSSQTLYTLVKSSPLKCKCFRLLSAQVKMYWIPHVSFELTSQFLFKFYIILHCIRHNSPVNFKHIHFLLWIKGPYKSPNFETFVRSGEILANSSCRFPNQKPVFLQILHHSL